MLRTTAPASTGGPSKDRSIRFTFLTIRKPSDDLVEQTEEIVFQWAQTLEASICAVVQFLQALLQDPQVLPVFGLNRVQFPF